MKTLFRKKFIIQFLEELEEEEKPVDLFLRKKFRSYKQIGSKDRKEIANTIYSLIRFRSLVDFLCSAPITWEKRLTALEKITSGDIPKDIPEHIRASFPKLIYDKLLEFYGATATKQICCSSNEPAPTTIRINPLKTTREKVLQLLQLYCQAKKCQFSELGITLESKINLLGLESYKKGYFEIQDEASQLICSLMDVKPKDKVLDFCAGSGGKTLGFGPKMDNKGVIYLYDIREIALMQARKRLKKSGIQNVQFLTKTTQIKGLMDWILTDVPCSGTGTLRRNPDMKWKYTQEMLDHLVLKQRAIVKNALKYLKKNGRLVYATCSILPEENEEQIEFFTKNFNLKLVGSFFKTIPKSEEMDGFFGAILQRKDAI